MINKKQHQFLTWVLTALLKMPIQQSKQLRRISRINIFEKKLLVSNVVLYQSQIKTPEFKKSYPSLEAIREVYSEYQFTDAPVGFKLSTSRDNYPLVATALVRIAFAYGREALCEQIARDAKVSFERSPLNRRFELIHVLMENTPDRGPRLCVQIKPRNYRYRFLEDAYWESKEREEKCRLSHSVIKAPAIDALLRENWYKSQIALYRKKLDKLKSSTAAVDNRVLGRALQGYNVKVESASELNTHIQMANLFRGQNDSGSEYPNAYHSYISAAVSEMFVAPAEALHATTGFDFNAFAERITAVVPESMRTSIVRILNHIELSLQENPILTEQLAEPLSKILVEAYVTLCVNGSQTQVGTSLHQSPDLAVLSEESRVLKQMRWLDSIIKNGYAPCWHNSELETFQLVIVQTKKGITKIVTKPAIETNYAWFDSAPNWLKPVKLVNAKSATEFIVEDSVAPLLIKISLAIQNHILLHRTICKQVIQYGVPDGLIAEVALARLEHLYDAAHDHRIHVEQHIANAFATSNV